jgi:NADH dehydrogenase [ubiquinone] 1 alpha subcomplex assembly factor 7
MESWLIPYIRERGSICIAEYVDHCLYHPEFGYYTNRNPLGTNSDFLTAPETSQMFGEMIGVCIVDLWQRMGSPEAHLLEMGPGQGTLMADLLRIAPEGFRDAIDVHMVDVSPVLREEQKQRVKHPRVQWYQDLEPALKACSGPTFIIANELFDAFCIEQHVQTEGGWQERRVTLGPDGKTFVFTPDHAPDALIREYCPLAAIVMKQMAKHMVKYGGLTLAIDYGYMGPAFGDSLQGLRQHMFHDILKDPGSTDITAHVDFKVLLDAAVAAGAEVHGPTTQGCFLTELGILFRAEILKKNAMPSELTQIDHALHRLLDPTQMGELFKVMAVCGKDTPTPVGFSRCIQAVS